MLSLQKFISALFIANVGSLFITICRAAPASIFQRTDSDDEFSKAALLKEFDRPWILDLYGDTNLNANDKKVFGVSVGSTLPDAATGRGNIGIATLKADYKGHKGSEVVAKALPSLDQDAYSEVKALKLLTPNDFINSGMLSGWPRSTPSPVILMKKVPGKIIDQIPQYSHMNDDQKDSVLVHLQKMVCGQVVKWAVQHRALVADMNPGNVLVIMEGTTIKSMQMIDFGSPGLFTISKTVKEQEIRSHGRDNGVQPASLTFGICRGKDVEYSLRLRLRANNIFTFVTVR
ncbi:hypothetical protein GYMLUDRAFT_56596 [Collybiopsis luxurians FD-317 M1]|nr:hypothetical protein GYMLUDRAFT_56596 [Collybiopsis luxurians FD-317 M1]